MIDYEKIGQRITEQRKYILHISQERMAEDLGMYQADISNLEKAKKGSGITDLYKLETIADYFGITLDSLLFGKGENEMVKYYGKKMELHQSQKKLSQKHLDILKRLTGNEETPTPYYFECGPYSLYVLVEHQQLFDNDSEFIDGKFKNPSFHLDKLHIYVLLGDDVIATAVAAISCSEHLVYAPFFKKLCFVIPHDVLDVSDAQRILNPYIHLFYYEDNEEKRNAFQEQMYKRMDAIRSLGMKYVLFIENAYVREDCRKHGIMRMLIDLLRQIVGECIIWLNMEPTAGAELTEERGDIPSYTVSEAGQINMNAAIAERLGFTVDPDPWHRQAEVIEPDGSISTKVILVRKCAYYLPQCFRDLIKDDGDLVAIGRAKQKLKLTSEQNEIIGDFRDGNRYGFAIIEWKEHTINGPDIGKVVYCYAAHSLEKEDVYRFGVSYRSVFDLGIDHEGQIEQYFYLDDATESEYFERLCQLNALLTSRINGSKLEL